MNELELFVIFSLIILVLMISTPFQMGHDKVIIGKVRYDLLT